MSLGVSTVQVINTSIIQDKKDIKEQVARPLPTFLTMISDEKQEMFIYPGPIVVENFSSKTLKIMVSMELYRIRCLLNPY